MAQGAMAGPEHARLEQAVADPTVDKPILKAVAKPTRPAADPTLVYENKDLVSRRETRPQTRKTYSLPGSRSMSGG